MRHKEDQSICSAEKVDRDIRSATRRQYSAPEKILIELESLLGEDSIAGLCCKVR